MHKITQDSHTARFLFEKLLKGHLLANRTVVSIVRLSYLRRVLRHLKILVTHHVELVLPGTHYLVRMLDGRIDTQGLVKELRTQGILNDITREESIEVDKEEQNLEEQILPSAENTASIDHELDADIHKQVKRPRKLIEEEKREEGSVKWRIYKTYLKAS
jgi:hypothetical protein